MKRLAGYVLLGVLVPLPAHAVLPMAFFAKDLVKGIVRNFVEGQLNSMMETTGPCGMTVARPGAGAVNTIRQGAAAVRSPGTAMAGGVMPSLPGAGAGMDEERMKDMMARVPGGQGMQGGMAGLPPEVAAMMKDQTPLSKAEAEELGTLMERMSAAAPSAASKCKPGELKQMMEMTANTPGASGPMRMMLTSLRKAQAQIDEARATFAKMSEAERSDYVETMATEYRGWDAENKKAFVGMVETNFLGMPETMRTQLLARLKQVG